MTPPVNDDEFLDVAGAILDGVPVDWPVLGLATSSEQRSLIDQLWAVGRIADVHRRAPEDARERWGPFTIIERLGSGAFGDVFRAFDASLHRDVALKLLRSPAAGRHVAEGRLLARVRHPNVVTVHGAAAHDGVDGIWTEFINGRTLAQIAAEGGPLDPQHAAAIGLDLCGALAAVHASGLLHGDIKAQNVMREDGGRIVLMDFGTGRIAGDGARAGLAGTPLYIAPEVLEGAAADAAADVYSLGVTLFLLLTGSFPVEGQTLREIRSAHARGVRASVRQRRPDVPRRMAAVVDRAIASKDERFPTAAAFGAALRTAAAAPVRRRVTAMAAAALTLATLAIGAWRMRAPAIAVSDIALSLTPTAVIARNHDGVELWRHAFPSTHTVTYADPGTKSQIVGAPNAGVFVASSYLVKKDDAAPQSGQLLKLTPEGAVQASFSFDDRATFNRKPYGPPWVITTFAVDTRSPSHRVAVAAHHYQWSASMVAVLDETLTRRGTYWQWGWIEWVHWLAADRLMIGGYNDAHEGGMIALLDPSNLNAQAPETIDGRRLCDTCGAAPPLRMVVMPPTEINTATVSRFNRAVLQTMPDRVIARTIEMEQTGDHPAIDVLYEFSPQLDLLRASFGGSYWDMHASLERQGKLTHSRDTCPDRDGPREVIVWTPERGWKHVSVPRETL